METSKSPLLLPCSKMPTSEVKDCICVFTSHNLVTFLGMFGSSALIHHCGFISGFYRVVSSTQLDDRRDAVRAIKALAKKYKVEVGTLCTDVLLDILSKDKMDSEIVGYAVETLWNVTEIERLGSGEDRMSRPEIQFSEVIVQKQENITLLLNLLEDFEFNVRRPTTVLLWVLLQNKQAEMQDAILVIPQGISRVIDLLSDSREVIRNDAILLLAELTKSNKQIQKIVAFENAFDRLLAIVSEEGYSDGGIVVEDCINVLLNLLKGNNSNQSYFRETNLINHLVPFFDFKLSTDSNTWSPQKVANVLQMLCLVRTLVSPNNPQQSTASCQKLILQCRLLEFLCTFMFGGGVPTEILTDTITTVAEVIRGCEVCQKYLENVSTPSTPPRPAILAILMSMVTEKQPLVLRLSALYCFICYVYKNEESQCNIINTLLPSSAEPTSITPGQILIAGLFGNDPLSNWCTAVAISNALNEGLKAQLLRVQLSMQGGSQVTLLQQITMFLSQRSDLRVQTRVGLLILLCTWLADCSLGVTQFLTDTTNVPFLIGQLEQNYSNELGQLSRCLCATLLGISLVHNTGASPEYGQEALRQIIDHRIGKDAFLECLHHISSSEFFTKAAKYPHNRATELDEVCFDHNFTVFFKQVSDVVIRTIETGFITPQSTVQSQSNGSVANVDTSIEDHDSIVNQYKDLIRDQDEELTTLREKYTLLEKERSQDARTLQEQSISIRTLQEQVSMYASLKDSVTDGADAGSGSASLAEVEQLQGTIVSMQRLQDSQRQELASKNVEVEKLQQELKKLSLAQEKASRISSGEVERLKDELSQAKADNEALLTDRKAMEEEIDTLQRKLAASQVQTPSQNVEELQRKVLQLETSLEEVTEKKRVMEAEQEDLLIVLSESDTKIKQYRALLIDKGVPIPEDEEEEEDEAEDEDSEDGEQEGDGD